ncbi:MAG: topoisomerase DNA-binding C4 zinc finger domain-containing protein [Bacteroidetes bacterium]|nr:topoisomerase DNA-binding C4 zinc finger domain-containing protein [Bacteroidota bacterium]
MKTKNIWPQCCARLVLKNGNYEMLYGCASFPKCNY